MKHIKIAAALLVASLLLILFVPIPASINFYQNGAKIVGREEYISSNTLQVYVRGTLWRSIAGFSRLNGTARVTNGSGVLDFEYNFVSLYPRIGRVFASTAYRERGTLPIELATIYFSNSFDTFAIVISDGTNNNSYIVASSDPDMCEQMILEFFRYYIYI